MMTHELIHPDSDRPVAIIGAGPIGLEVAVALRRLDLPFQVFDAGSLGQTMTWWAPGTRWFSSNDRIAIAGVPLLTPDQTKATREQYLTYLRGVARQFNIEIRTHYPIIDIRRESDGFIVVGKPVRGRIEHPAAAVVLAIGGTDHPRRLGIPGEDLPHVDGYLRETHRYFGRRVLIVGGRNSAVEAAIRLHHAGARVAISYRADALPLDSIKYWLRPEIQGLIDSGQIEGHFGTVPIAVSPDAVTLRSLTDSHEISVPADDVLTLIGYEQEKSLLNRAGVELEGENRAPVYHEATMETNVPGIYVAGTAVAGTQSSKFRTFLENCHHHADKIAAALRGQAPATAQIDPSFEQIIRDQPES